MSGLNSQIRDRIEAFVSELADMIRRSTLDSVTEALGGGGGLAPAARVRPGKGGAGDASRERGGKRTPDEISRTTQLVSDFVAENPGQGVEQIAKALGLPTKELTLPIKKLIATEGLLTQGQKRATKYYPAGAAETATTGRSSAPRAAKGGARGRRPGAGKKSAAKGRGRKRS